jgi:hypothetical protein
MRVSNACCHTTALYRHKKETSQGRAITKSPFKYKGGKSLFSFNSCGRASSSDAVWNEVKPGGGGTQNLICLDEVVSSGRVQNEPPLLHHQPSRNFLRGQ